MCKYSVGMYKFILHLNKLSPSIPGIVHEVTSGMEAILHPNNEAACIQFWQQAGKIEFENECMYIILYIS